GGCPRSPSVASGGSVRSGCGRYWSQTCWPYLPWAGSSGRRTLCCDGSCASRSRCVCSVGLCLTCRWMRSIANRRGSTFYRCGLADSDPRFPRYPPLPVLSCNGYERAGPDTEGRGGEGGEVG